MKTSLFGHELRAALREARWFLPLPSLVLLLGVALWHSLWLTHSGNPTGGGFTETQRQARVLLDTVWPYVAWLVPYSVFKFPDLKDPAAFWRTTPVRPGIVFGTRILLAVVFTVILPALLFGGALWFVFPEIARDQMLTAIRNQWLYFVYGAFAALCAKGHRGLLIVLLMGLTWRVTTQVGSDFYLSVIEGVHGQGRYYFNPLTAWIPGDIFGLLLAPLILGILIRYSAKTFRLAPWIAATAGLVMVTIFIPVELTWKLLSLFSQSVPASQKELPVAHAVIEPLSPEDSRKEVLRERAIHGARVDPKLSFFARATLAPKTGEYALSIGDVYGRSNCQAFTAWNPADRSLPRVAFDGGLTATIPDAERPDRRAILRDYAGLPPYSREDDARAQMEAIAGDPELQVLTRAESSGAPRTWVRLADLKHDDTVVFFLSEKEKKRKAGVALEKNEAPEIPPRLYTTLRLVRPAPPKVILRCPAATGGVVRTDSEIISVAPMVMERGYGRAPINSVRRSELISPVLPGMFAPPYRRPRYSGEYQVVLINRKRHQAVTSFLGSRMGSDSGFDASVSHMINEVEVRDVDPLIDREWIGEAELVVYGPGDDESTCLPVELTRAGSDRKSR